MAPTTRADNKDKHPGYLVLSKVPQTTQSPSKSRAKSQLEHETIIKDITVFEGQLYTKKRQSRSMASQPPGPLQEKQSHSQPVHEQCSSGQRCMSYPVYLLTMY